MMQAISKKAQQRWTMKGAAAAIERLKSLPASAVILDPAGTIVAVNDTWKEFGRQNGLRIPRFAIGSNYLQYCRSKEPRLRRFTKELKALLAGQLDLLTYIYPCHSPIQERWFSLIGFPLSLDKPGGVALLHVNLTDVLSVPISAPGARARGERSTPNRPVTNLDAISGAIERSVSETLSSQLNAMFTGTRQNAGDEKTAARGEVDQASLVHSRLSKRQMEVLRLLGEGQTNKEMAKTLLLSPNTIKLHVSAILQRLKLKSRTHAALLSSNLNKQGWADMAAGEVNSGNKTLAAARHRRSRRAIRVRTYDRGNA